jgi:hypothetical protein
LLALIRSKLARVWQAKARSTGFGKARAKLTLSSAAQNFEPLTEEAGFASDCITTASNNIVIVHDPPLIMPSGKIPPSRGSDGMTASYFSTFNVRSFIVELYSAYTFSCKIIDSRS